MNSISDLRQYVTKDDIDLVCSVIIRLFMIMDLVGTTSEMGELKL